MLLYIGNNLKSDKITVTTMVTLSQLLISEGYPIKMASSIDNKLLRMLDMLWVIFKNRHKVSYVLIDTYSTNNFYYAVCTSQLCRLLKLKYIPILHGGNLPKRLKTASQLSRLIFANSYKNIAPSQYLKSEFSLQGYESTFIPNIIEVQKLSFLERKIESPKLLYVRAFSKIYNPELAIKVLDHLKKTYPKAMLCMIGPEKDDSFQSCKVLANALGLEDCIEFAGKLTKSAWHEKAKDFNIFINTTNVDNTPISVMEAMALGLPIVSTNVGGIPYLITNGVNGVLVEKDNIAAMTKAIIEVCKHKEFSKTLTINARKDVEKFDWKKIKHLWLKILQ
jgi:glycosyltransferase involved in cell wall biosynthesis